MQTAVFTKHEKEDIRYADISHPLMSVCSRSAVTVPTTLASGGMEAYAG